MKTNPNRIGLAFYLATALSLSVPTKTMATLTVTPSQLGNVFYTTETVSIPVNASLGTTVVWVATDYYGTTVGSGTAAVSGGTATILPTTGTTIGYFDLALTEKTGTTVNSTQTTQFVKLTPIDITTMGSSPYGLHTQFSQFTPTAIDPLIARAGIAQFRDEQYWNNVENPKGTFIWPTKFTNYMSAASTAKLNPLLILDWGNQFYDWDTTGTINPIYTAPYSSTGLAGYGNYALRVLNKYGSQVGQVEVWNEYNAGTFIKGTAATNKGYYYKQALQSVWNAIKPTYPNVKVVAGGTVPVAAGFIKSFLDNGANPYVDVFSVHPYQETPEGVDVEISSLINLVKGYNGGVAKPIWATEFSMNAIDEEGRYEQASYIPRIVTQMQSSGVARMYYYLAMDDTYFPYRGLLAKADAARGNYLPNPVYVSYGNLIRQLYGWMPEGRGTGTLASTTYIYKYVKGSDHKYVCWGGSGLEPAPTTISISTTAASATVTDFMGNVTTVTASGGKVQVTVGLDPVYVTLVGTAAIAFVEASNPVIADSIAGYSGTQGTWGWSYGTVTGAYSQAGFTALPWGIWGTDNYRWRAPSGYPFIGSTAQHPWSGACTVRRWTSNAACTATISGTIRGPSSGSDGIYCKIYVNGVAVYSPALITAGQVITYSVPNVALSNGTVVDFVENINASSNFDATGWIARITAQSTQGSGSFVTGQTLGTIRNNFTGKVGFKFTVGNSPITINQLGRWMVAGNTQTHALQVVLASTGVAVAGGTTSVNMSGGTAGQFKYADLPTPITLSANTAYYIASQETSGGDQWYDNNTTLTTTADATLNGAVFSSGGTIWNGPYGTNTSYVPVSFKMGGAARAFVTGQTLGTIRNNYSGYLGFKFTVGSTPITISKLGRWVVAGNTGTHAVKIVLASTGADVSGGTTSVNTSGAPAGQFKYADLPTPITLSANTAYYIASQETSGGDQWYDNNTTLTTTADAALNGSIFSSGGTTWNGPYGTNTSYVPVSLMIQ